MFMSCVCKGNGVDSYLCVGAFKWGGTRPKLAISSHRPRRQDRRSDTHCQPHDSDVGNAGNALGKTAPFDAGTLEAVKPFSFGFQSGINSSSYLLLVVRTGAPSSVLAPSGDARSS